MVVSAEFELVVIGRVENNVSCTWARISSYPAAATMKRVADSQLTKDSEDGDDGPEVNGR